MTQVATIKEVEQYLPQEIQKEVSTDLTQAIQASKALRVTSEATMEEANGLAGKIRARQKGIESFRLAIVAPFKQHIAKIDKFFKDLQGNFDEPLDTLEGKVTAYRLSRKQQLETTSYQEGVGRTTFIKRAEFEVIDEATLPDEFWCVDKVKLGARVRELTKDLKVGQVYTDKISGVKITCVERASYAGEKTT